MNSLPLYVRITPMLKRMRQQIDKSLNEFLEKSKSEYKLDLAHPILYESIRNFVLRPGKRIRPLLLILSYKGYRTSTHRMSPSIYYVSSCVELLHNFMLIHDDIIDRSDLRRGKPTMHRMLEKLVRTEEKEKLGSDLSIVTGDIVYALAIDAFLSIKEDYKRKERALKYFLQTAVITAMGEFIDTYHGVQKINKVREKDVYLNYSMKTARYTFDCPLVVGAILAGAGNKDVRLLSDIGLQIGQAFQIQDDIIGIFDTQTNIGKSILSDIAESKKTLLVCHANDTLKGAKRQKFLSYFNKKKNTYTDLVAIRKIFIDSGSLDYSLNALHQRLTKSRVLLNRLSIKPSHLKLIKQSFSQLFLHSNKIEEKFK